MPSILWKYGLFYFLRDRIVWLSIKATFFEISNTMNSNVKYCCIEMQQDIKLVDLLLASMAPIPVVWKALYEWK